MLEAGVLIDLDGNVLFEHLPEGRSVAYLPDSRDLWSAIWESRDRVRGFAHSHPGGGSPTPSHTDVTTFHAIELGLGKQLDWWVTTSESVGLFRKLPGNSKYDYTLVGEWDVTWWHQPRWLGRLVAMTGY